MNLETLARKKAEIFNWFFFTYHVCQTDKRQDIMKVQIGLQGI